MDSAIKQLFSIASADKSENGDAYYVSSDATVIALADSATQSFLGPLWARILVENFGKFPHKWLSLETIGEVLKETRQLWYEKATEWVKEKFKENIPSWVEMGVKEGAASTFLGAKIFILDKVPSNSKSNIILCAINVGDTCMFLIRNKQLFKSFPIRNSKEFSNYPPLIYSYNEWNEREILFSRISLFPNDLLIFMTDKMAQFFLKVWEEGRSDIIEEIMKIETMEAWINFLERQRKEGEWFDDDLTQISIYVNP